MGDIDVYVAIEFSKRDESIALFAENYLKGFQVQSDYFEYPSSFQSEIEFETDNYLEMLSFIRQTSDRAFRFYFEDSANKETRFAYMFFNADGSLFLGLGVYPEYQLKYEEKLRADFKSPLIMVCYNTIPPDNLVDFKIAIE